MPQDHGGIALCMTEWPQTSSVNVSEKSDGNQQIDSVKNKTKIFYNKWQGPRVIIDTVGILSSKFWSIV